MKKNLDITTTRYSVQLLGPSLYLLYGGSSVIVQ